MADYITLMGAEEVSSAGHRMSAAADTMRSAASTMLDASEQIRRTLDDFLIRFEEVIAKHPNAHHQLQPNHTGGISNITTKE